MVRILKFAGGFLITLLIVFFIVFGHSLDALSTLWDNQAGIKEGQEWVEKTFSLKGLTEYIGAQPQRVSVASLALANPDSSIRYNTHSPRTMGRLSVLFSLVAYADGVETGRINPNEHVSLETINRYQLPYMDATDHDAALEYLQPHARQDSVALKHLIDAAASFNDIAITDFLYDFFGATELEGYYDQLNLQETELPLPFNGLYITINPPDSVAAENHFRELQQLPYDSLRQIVTANARHFLTDEPFRDRQEAAFEDAGGLNMPFMQRRNALAFFPKTTAAEMARLMEQIQQNKLISRGVSQRLKTILGWPLRQDNRLSNDFATYGALYDNRMGMVNGIDFGSSTYSEEPFAQAVFFDELQVAFWFHMSSNLMHQDFEQRLIWDPALRAATVQQISANQSAQ